LTTTIHLRDTQKDFTFFLVFLINHNNVEFDVLKVVITKNSIFWSVTPCSFVTNQMAKHPILVETMCFLYAVTVYIPTD